MEFAVITYAASDIRTHETKARTPGGMAYVMAANAFTFESWIRGFVFEGDAAQATKGN